MSIYIRDGGKISTLKLGGIGGCEARHKKGGRQGGNEG